VIKSWLRVTTGSSHVLNVDWVAQKVLPGINHEHYHRENNNTTNSASSLGFQIEEAEGAVDVTIPQINRLYLW
jgi:hypothetical protein